MGGKALGYVARRINTDEMRAIEGAIIQLYPEFNPRLIEAYRAKADHGDIDFVLCGNYADVRDAVFARTAPSAFHDNKPVLSFDYEGVQVDFTVCSTPALQEAQWGYMAWNDLGNFVGRTARSLNFKFGHEGLKYPLRLSEHKQVEIPVSMSIPDSLEFLGYDPVVWRAGFDTKDQIFAYAASSPYFNPTYFSLNKQAHQDRTRNKKRRMYQGMVAFIEEHGLQEMPELTQEERDVHITRAGEFFGTDLRFEIEQQEYLYSVQVALSAKYNGDLVREWTGKQGKELGALVSGFKTVVCPNFEEYLRVTDATRIRSDFEAWYRSVQQPNPE